MPKVTRAEKRLLCIPDAHVPYHDVRAVNLVIEVIEATKPDIVIVMGDWWDFWKVSRYKKRHAELRHSFMDEFTAGEELLAQINAPRKEFIEGNHEIRLQDYIDSDASDIAELLDRKKVGVKHTVKALGWNYTPYMDILKLGKVYYSHDFGRSGKNAVHLGASDIQHSFVIGHTHRLDYAVEGDPLDGTKKLCSSFGWLGSFDDIDYYHKARARREWAHGFGFGYMRRDGTTWWQPIPIVRGVACVEGRIFKG